ncbi:hypothetical protein CC1G_12172 [Coprinopsis cinerea okayama7|uniref:C2H2-type domain-containing protein n=1 Tax=Coprinopsis cinerea (strain Okayama-7 / 130 / ATCC MYA-4618 / FGSC 9003) TaxID=240176 RepID=A8NHM1_COPC7|nr:hypothetical protein CC1G_12172 [Coprinopsis cinerea okayama7\|eukprot:XP_001833790.1 hypothetical protein CC1G_12172 [Coprinopsis cinerea okayama7\
MSNRTRNTYKPKPYRCSQCGKGYTSPHGLKQHRRVHELPVALRKIQDQQQPQTQHLDSSRVTVTRSESPEQLSSVRSPSLEPQILDTPSLTRPPNRVETHPILDGTPCDAEGFDYDGPPEPPFENEALTEICYPFNSPSEFRLADFLYVKSEMSAGKIDELIEILAELYPNEPPPMANHRELYALIDSIKEGEVPWDSFSVTYNGEKPTHGSIPPWMMQPYEVWFRDPLKVMESQIGNPDFKEKIDYAPKRVYQNDKRQWKDLMSGNWAWKQADILSKDINNHGAMFAPIVMGSDKTTVSIATGQNDFYPLYASLGNVHNSVRRAHRNAVALIGFLAIPKTSREYANDPKFRHFRRQLFHTSLRHILSSLEPYMTTPRITRCGDGYFRRVIYGLGPYIADYPEQALLACIVQGWCPICTAPSNDLDKEALDHQHVYRSHDHTDDLCTAFSLREVWDDYGIVGDIIPFTAYFPRANIHELISPDLLHQLIKGTFKDHLVDWTVQYLTETLGKQEAESVLADIDRRIAVTSPFPGLRRFYEGRGFKQWTGDDSKGLMKVLLPAIAGHVPDQIVHTFRDFLEFTYLVRRSVITEDDLERLDNLVASFHRNREIFRDNVRPTGFSLPRQHSMVHYRHLIQQFGAPNGLCSSITESKHIKAVKKPYRRSNRNRPLGQMLVTNQRTDKILAMRTKFRTVGASSSSTVPQLPLEPSTVPATSLDLESDHFDADAIDEPASMGDIKLAKRAVPRRARNVYEVASEIQQPQLIDGIRQYLYNYTANGIAQSSQDIPLDLCPDISALKIHTYPSARADFFAPSDVSGIEGMRTERIRAVRSWQGGRPRYDCVFIGASDEPGFRGLLVARVFLFFQLSYCDEKHPCALVQWYSTVGDEPCPDTGMWVVEPDFIRGKPSLDVIHLDSIFRAAHLIGYAGKHRIPIYGFDYTHSLDHFRVFYVNKYADHNAHEIAS